MTQSDPVFYLYDNKVFTDALTEMYLALAMELRQRFLHGISGPLNQWMIRSLVQEREADFVKRNPLWLELRPADVLYTHGGTELQVVPHGYIEQGALHDR